MHDDYERLRVADKMTRRRGEEMGEELVEAGIASLGIMARRPSVAECG